MAFEARHRRFRADGRAKGNFDAAEPGGDLDRRALDGNVNGTVDATVRSPTCRRRSRRHRSTFDGRVVAARRRSSAACRSPGPTSRAVTKPKSPTCSGSSSTDQTSPSTRRDGWRSTDVRTSNLKFRITRHGHHGARAARRSGVARRRASPSTAHHGQRGVDADERHLGRPDSRLHQHQGARRSTASMPSPCRSRLRQRPRATRRPTRPSSVIGGIELNQLKATTTYAKKELEFATRRFSSGRESSTPSGASIFHPDHQELHLPALAIRTDGIEWTNVPGSEAAIQYRPDEVSIKDLRLASGDQRSTSTGRWS